MRTRLIVAFGSAVVSLLVGMPAKAAPSPTAIRPTAARPTAIRPTAIRPTAASPTAIRPAAARPTAVRLMTFNICGNVCRQGEVTDTAGNIAYQIRRRVASVVLLQEVCYAQFLGLQENLSRYGYEGTFAAASNAGHCNDFDHAHGNGFGVAVFARGALSGRVAHRLPSPWGLAPEGRVVLGVTVRLAGRDVFVVTTHTSPGGPNLAVQLGSLGRWLAPIAATRPVLFGGDLNTVPEDPGLNAFYADFREANTGRLHPLTTFVPIPRKIDYLFGSRSFLTPVGVATGYSDYSDHRMYVGAFRF